MDESHLLGACVVTVISVMAFRIHYAQRTSSLLVLDFSDRSLELVLDLEIPQ